MQLTITLQKVQRPNTDVNTSYSAVEGENTVGDIAGQTLFPVGGVAGSESGPR